ncbi:GNAT family N-acetyltransferase [Tersicoccus sp. MR15.9]|uniref:GNAT family N-acetyltransferase n=1 Tax=Tersicoccus mangrovi TaxID=3121635 RepID=UPI002FE6100C
MTTDVVLREATDEDEGAIAALVAASPDTGAVTFRPRLQVSATQAHDTVHDATVQVVAESTDGTLVGSAALSRGTCRFEGAMVPYALLHSLVVGPEHRRQGIGRALATWRLDRAGEALGEDGVVLANIQQGNAASSANAAGWATSTSARTVVAPVPMRRRPPRGVDGVTLDEAEPGDLEAVAAGICAFSGSHNFGLDWTAERLAAWLASSPFDDPVNHCLVARTRAGDVVAGLALREEGRIRALEVVHMPASVRLANLALHVVPRDGVLRNLAVDRIWFAPGQLRAARALWEHARWAWRERGSDLLVNLDPRGPAWPVVGVRPWSPTTVMRVAVRSARPLDPDRIVDPLL